MNVLFLSDEAISIAVRYFFRLYHVFRCKVSLTNIILKTICQMYNETILDVLHEILHQIIIYIINKGANLQSSFSQTYFV